MDSQCKTSEQVTESAQHAELLVTLKLDQSHQALTAENQSAPHTDR